MNKDGEISRRQHEKKNSDKAANTLPKKGKQREGYTNEGGIETAA